MTDILYTRRAFYHPNLCHTCKKITKTLKVCGRCKAISYCSREHQVDNWLYHKDLCKAIVETDKILTVEVLNRAEEQDKRRRINCFQAAITMWEKKLQRSITNLEADFIMYRRSCLVCNSLKAPFQCDNCLSVFYCSKEHQQNDLNSHERFCKNIKLNFDLLVFRFHSQNTFYPKFTHKSILLQVLPSKLDYLFQYLYEKGCMKLKKKLSVLEFLESIDTLAPAANIIFALEKAGLIKDRHLVKANLVVHIIASRDIDDLTNWALIIEFLFHWIKNLKHCTCIVVGGCSKSWTYSLQNTSSICGFCNMKATSFKCFATSDYYHNVLNRLAKPDLVTVFNSNIFEVLLWKSSIPCLVKYPMVPLIITEFKKGNLRRHLEQLKNNVQCRKIEIILQLQENPFACLGPFRYDFKLDPIVYKNAYVAIVRGTLAHSGN